MLRSIKDLTGYSILATDGKAGNFEECYFDDQQWILRYLVIHTSGWLTGKSVLIRPTEILSIDWNQQVIRLNLTCKEIEQAPGPETHLPTASRLEEGYYQYLSWPYFWTGAGAWGTIVPETIMSPPPKEMHHIDFLAAHLRSSSEIIGYKVKSDEMQKGKLLDLLMQDGTWRIPFAVIRPGNGWFHKPILIPSQSIDLIDWSHRSVHYHSHEQQPPQVKRAA